MSPHFCQADIVKYRDKVSGKLVEARVPTAVLALLKLRASCSGKPVSEQKLARMAVDVPLVFPFHVAKVFFVLLFGGWIPLKKTGLAMISWVLMLSPNDFQQPKTVNVRMEEHAFDPVRAVASLSPSSLLCPTGALRVLGSGFIGIVFLEEEPDAGDDDSFWVVVFWGWKTLEDFQI